MDVFSVLNTSYAKRKYLMNELFAGMTGLLKWVALVNTSYAIRK